jgi:hypothetical protein
MGLGRGTSHAKRDGAEQVAPARQRPAGMGSCPRPAGFPGANRDDSVSREAPIGVEREDVRAIRGILAVGVFAVAAALARHVSVDSSGLGMVELAAAFLCYLFALPLVGIPSLVVFCNAVFPQTLHRATCELCAVWLLWNGGW